MRILLPSVVVLLLTSTVVPANRGLDIYWCDVEGGAATLIVTPAGESLLVDCGWPGERDANRISKLAREVAGLQQIDHYLTTHWHTDHFGGIALLAERIPVRRFYDHGFPTLPQPDITPGLVEAYNRVAQGRNQVLRAGDRIPLKQGEGSAPVALNLVAAHGVVSGEGKDAPGIRACTANPPHEAKPEDVTDNARSLAFVLGFGNWKFFDAGDLTWNIEHKLICPRSLVDKIDVYQVTHHGADTSNHPALLKALDPRVAIMNNGAKKGGSGSVVRALKGLGGLEGLFAVHRNIQTSADDNASVELTANDGEQCIGEYIKLSVAPDAKSYTVSIPSKGTSRTFRIRQ